MDLVRAPQGFRPGFGQAEEADADVDRMRQQLQGLCLVRRLARIAEAEVHAAEADGGHLQALGSKSAAFHQRPPCLSVECPGARSARASAARTSGSRSLP